MTVFLGETAADFVTEGRAITRQGHGTEDARAVGVAALARSR